MLYQVAIVYAVCLAICVGISSADDCAECDSNKDEKCASYPSALRVQKCNTPPNSNELLKCYVRIVDGVTYRGCFHELDEAVQRTCLNDSMGQNCIVCENINGVNGCNRMIFPINRLRCHSCSEKGLSGNCYTGYEANATPCKKYAADDKCYIRKSKDSIRRGCLSDENSNCVNVSHCMICDGDGCNNLAGNNTYIPTAPSSAAAWTSTMAILLVTVLTSYVLTS